jgi:K+-sensing histidine kinase KdpD
MNVERTSLIRRHPGAVLLLSALAPLAASAALAPFRATVATTNAALLLVLIVVAAASTGLRFAGVVAALSSAVFFDFFLTAPFHRLAINDRADVETAVLLVLVGVAVTEVALWGRRQQARASRQQGYLAGVLQTVGAVSTARADPVELTHLVAEQLRDVLHIDDARFTTDLRPVTSARLNHDGTVTREGRKLEVDTYGLPTDTEIELEVHNAGVRYGRFLLVAATRICRPDLEQRRVALALADQVGAAMADRAGAELAAHGTPSADSGVIG